MNPELTEDQYKKLEAEYQELLKFYWEKVHEVVIASERIDKEQRLSLSAIIEMRSGFTHVMRAHAVMLGTIKADLWKNTKYTAFTYCQKNLDKAHGHLYRAAYDAYDIIAVTTSLEINHKVEGLSQEAIYSVIKNAGDLMAKYTNANNLVSKAKSEKDIGSKQTEEEQFLLYEKACNDIVEVNEQLNHYMGAIIGYEKSIRAKKGWHIAGYVIGTGLTVAALVFGILSYFKQDIQTPDVSIKSEQKESAPKKVDLLKSK